MKINSLDLGTAFTQVRSAINPKHGYFSHILIEADDEIRLTGTNGNLFVRSNVDAGLIVEPGAVLIDASKLGQLNSLNKPFDLEQDDKIAHIKCGRSKLKFPLIDANTFPRIAPPFSEPWLQVNFLSLIEQVLFAASEQNSGRAEFESISMQSIKDGFVLVSTNGYRISELFCKSDLIGFEPILLSSSSLKACYEVLKGSNKHDVWIEDNQCKISFEKTLITARLIDGSFPDYTSIIPRNPEVVFNAEVKDLLEALKITTIAEGDSHCIGLHGDNKILTFWTFNGTYQASEFVETTKIQTPFKTGINSKFLIEALKHVKGSTVEFQFPDPPNACLITDIIHPEHRQVIACMSPPPDLP